MVFPSYAFVSFLWIQNWHQYIPSLYCICMERTSKVERTCVQSFVVCWITINMFKLKLT